ncbi:MAG: glycosyltransferase family 4 protein [candidate division WOR-3 bacterium]
MKILLFNWQDIKHPLAGGAEIYLYEIFKRLLNHEIIWLGCSHESLKDEDFYDNIKVFRYGKWEFANYSLPILYFKKIKKNYEFDIVIESISKAPFYTPFFIKSKKITVFIPHLFGRTIYEEANPLIATYVYLLEKPVSRVYRNNKFIVISNSTKEELIRRGIDEKNIRVVFPGIGERYKPSFEKSEKPLILYLGRMKKYKRIDYVLMVFKRVSERIKDADFYLIGEGDYRKNIEKMAKEMNIYDRIKFTGFVPEEEKIKFLQKAWVIINTSPKEGWGMVNTEAQRCGTPCITFDSPGLKETVKDNFSGFLIKYGNWEEMAEKVIYLIENNSLREKMYRNAFEWSKNFDWDKSANEFENFLMEKSW